MRRVQRRRLWCVWLTVTILLPLYLLYVLYPPMPLSGARLHAGPALPITAPPSPPSQQEGDPADSPRCSSLNVSSAAAGVSWSPVPSPQLGDSGPYCVLYDWLAADRQPPANQSVTLCTHATADSAAQHAPLLAAAWSAPVSLAVFVLPEEARALAARLAHLRRCHAAFRRHVSVHLVFDRRRAPALAQLPAVAALQADCNQPPPSAEPSRRRQLGLPYPVNAARNAARRAARTRLVLVSDAELVPSPNAVSMFMDMMARLGGEARRASQARTNITNRQVSQGAYRPTWVCNNENAQCIYMPTVPANC